MGKWFALLFALSLPACSVYKSAVRKDFESNAPDRVVATGFGACEKMGALPAWIHREFPEPGAELLLSESDVEAWKIETEDGRVLIRSFRSFEEGVESCTHEFANATEWDAHSQTFFSEL